MHAHIVKRRGRTEAYDNHKVYASCYAACLNAECGKEEAENICKQVTSDIDTFVGNRDSVTSDEIFRKTTRAMRKRHDKAAFMYETHRDVS